MVLEAAQAASLAGCDPARWSSADRASIDLLSGTPVNCVLDEQSDWSAALSRAARAAGIAALGVVRDASDSKTSILRAKAAGISEDESQHKLELPGRLRRIDSPKGFGFIGVVLGLIEVRLVQDVERLSLQVERDPVRDWDPPADR